MIREISSWFLLLELLEPLDDDLDILDWLDPVDDDLDVADCDRLPPLSLSFFVLLLLSLGGLDRAKFPTSTRRRR